MARPTKWSKEIELEAWDYVNGKWESLDHAFPSVVGLCSVINLNRNTVYDWATHEDKEFSDILESINERQELIAWNKGLKGDYNANLVKLLLGKHGYKESSSTEVTGANGGPVKYENLTDNEIDDKLKSLINAVGNPNKTAEN